MSGGKDECDGVGSRGYRVVAVRFRDSGPVVKSSRKGRRCFDCNKLLSIYNRGRKCHVCKRNTPLVGSQGKL